MVYEEKVFLLSTNCAKEAVKLGCKVFIEVSTAQVYDGEKVKATRKNYTKFASVSSSA